MFHSSVKSANEQRPSAKLPLEQPLHSLNISLPQLLLEPSLAFGKKNLPTEKNFSIRVVLHCLLSITEHGNPSRLKQTCAVSETSGTRVAPHHAKYSLELLFAHCRTIQSFPMISLLTSAPALCFTCYGIAFNYFNRNTSCF